MSDHTKKPILPMRELKNLGSDSGMDVSTEPVYSFVHPPSQDSLLDTMDGEEPFDPTPELRDFESGAEVNLEGPHVVPASGPEAPVGGHGDTPGGDQREEALANDRAAESDR